MIIAVEALVVYNLIRTIYENTKHIKEGGIEVFSNCKKIVLEINKGLMNESIKATTRLRDGSASICETIKLIKKMQVGIFVGYIEGHLKGK